MPKKKTKKDDFVHLHVHSDMSQLDGAGKIPDYVKRASERGNPAIAFTDHGTMRGYLSEHEACEKVNIKPIFGSEFYVSPDMRRKGLTEEEKFEITKGLKKSECKAALKTYEEKIGLRDRWHLNVWAKNNEGLKNLYRLSSSAFIEGFYYKPRIDLSELKKYRKGLIVSTGCLSSPIHDNYQQGKTKASLDFADELFDAFGEDLRLELQPHDIREQVVANKLVMKLYDRYGRKAPIMATQDAHYIDQCDAEHHEVLLCIGTGSMMSNPARFKFDGDEFHMRTRSEMFSAFRKNHGFLSKESIKSALNATVEMSEIVDASLKIDYLAALLPKAKMPKEYNGDDFQFLKTLCLDGWKWRGIDDRSERMAKRRGECPSKTRRQYAERLKLELTSLKRQKFVPYFLIVRELYAFARSRQIMCGPGRGSAGGSLVAYLLGITSVDPIEHGLIFERFINPARLDMPDIDMDFEDRRRGEIIDWLIERFGRDKVAQIATIGKLSGKQCFRDVSRVLEVPIPAVNQITSLIMDRASGDERASNTIEDTFKESELCRKFDKEYPKVLHHASKLEGLAKNLGIHAAGVVASPVSLTDVIPLEIRKHDGRDVVVTSLDMHGVAALGLVKLDVLGLKTLTVIRQALEEIERYHGEKIDMESIDLDDKDVLKAFTDHDYCGVFQYDTPSAYKICAGVEFTDFENIAAMTALNRPGTTRSGLASKYIDRKKDPRLIKKIDFHEKVSKITEDTLGVIVYQEHVIKILTECAGYSAGEADKLRKLIGKKVGDETLAKERDKFVYGCKKHSGIDERTSNRIMDAIIFFGSYGFNKSHATAYGLIGYWCMWIKVRYPIEFFWALLRNETERDKISQIAKSAKKRGIKLLPPHVNSSQKEFSIDRKENAVRGSLIDIKGVGPAAADSIIENQPFNDWWDFISRVNRRKVHRGVVLALVKSGALSGMIPSAMWFVDNIGDLWKEISKKNFGSAKSMLAASEDKEDYSEEEFALVSGSVNPLAFGKHPIDAYESFINEHVSVQLSQISSDTFFSDNDGRGTYVSGVILGVKHNRIGDFHQGEKPTDYEKAKMFWGARYANVNIEDAGGTQGRCKFDFDVFESYKNLIDSGVGTPMIAHVVPSSMYENMRCQFAVDLGKFRDNIVNNKPLSVWERIMIGDHPAKNYPWKNSDQADKRISNRLFNKSTSGGLFTGVVTNVRPKYDKNGNQMAFFGMIGADDTFIDVIAFASVWHEVSMVIKPGRLIMVLIEKKPNNNGRWSYFCGDRIKVLKKTKVKKT